MGVAGIRSISWEQHHQLSELDSLLSSNTDVIVFQDVPNKRLKLSEHLRSFLNPTLGAAGHDPITTLLESGTAQIGWDPEEAVSQVQAAGYEAMIVPSPKTPITFDLAVFRPSLLLRNAARKWVFTRLSEFNGCSNTAQERSCRREIMSQQIRRSVFMHLFHKLPHYVSRYPVSQFFLHHYHKVANMSVTDDTTLHNFRRQHPPHRNWQGQFQAFPSATVQRPAQQSRIPSTTARSPRA